MRTGQSIVAAALGGALFIAATTGLSANEVCTSVTVKPLHSVSVNAGNTHVAGYYVNANGVCKLTLMFNEIQGENAETPALASRLQMTVEPGRSARFDRTDGKALQFACLNRAEGMTLSKLDRLAGISE